MFTGSFMGLAYLVTSSDSLKIFGYFVNSVTIFGSLIWVSLPTPWLSYLTPDLYPLQPCRVHAGHEGTGHPSIDFALHRGESDCSSTVRWLTSQPFQPYLTYASLGLTVLLSIFKGFDAFMPFDIKTFITSYIGIPVFVFGYLGFKRKLKMASAAVFNVSDQGHQVRQARRDGSHFGIARVRRP